MRELTQTETNLVDGGFGLLAIPAGLGLLISIPTIVFGAITGSFTFGLGYVVMTAGIVGTSLSGAAMLGSIVIPAL